MSAGVVAEAHSFLQTDSDLGSALGRQKRRATHIHTPPSISPSARICITDEIMPLTRTQKSLSESACVCVGAKFCECASASVHMFVCWFGFC